MDQDLLKSHFRSLNSKGAIALLRELAKKKGDRETAEKAVKLLKRSGGMILKYPRKGGDSAPGGFLEAMGAFLRDELECSDAQAELASHAEDCERISICFQAILESLEKSEAWKSDMGTRVWGWIERASREVAGILRALEEKQMEGQGVSVMSDTTIPVEDVHVDADSAVDLMNSNIVNSIKMVAGPNGWIEEETGEIVVPAKVLIDDDESFKVGTVFYLAKVWSLLDSMCDELRYFGGKTRREDLRGQFSISEEKKKETPPDWLVFDTDHEYAKLFLIALKRSTMLLIHWKFQVETYTNVGDKLGSPLESEVSLPPDAFVSKDELLSRIALEELFHWPVNESVERYSGLTISEWIRAYSVLKVWAEDLKSQKAGGVFGTTREKAISILQNGGLPREASEAFLHHCIFSKDSADFFDAPFLRDQKRGFHFLYRYLPGVQAHRLVMSQFGKMGHQIQSKGKRFEKEILSAFEQRGIECRSFPYKLDGVTYDCDVCVVWGNYIFVIECKNYSLPDHRPALEYFFIERMHEAIRQSKRIAAQLEANPEILTREFGRDITGKEFVPVVVNSMPWSIPGKTLGAYVYDSLALGKFLSDGAIRIKAPRSRRKGITTVHEHEIFRMWDGEEPTADEFLRELESISQHQMVKDEWELTSVPSAVSSELGVLTVFFRPLPENFERSLAALGCSQDEIEETLNVIEALQNSL